MSTSVANLDTTQYVKINSSRRNIVLQSTRDEVRIVLSDVKPSRSNTVFHTLNGGDAPLYLSNIDTDVWALSITGRSKLVITETRSSFVEEDYNTKTYKTDAWYRQKVVTDISLFHGMFTFNVPADNWYEMIDDVEQSSFSSATSVDGKLVLTSGALNEKRQLRSFRHPRYEPNRGHLYSTAMFLPSVDAAGERTFGLLSRDAGVAFRLRSGVLYAIRRTTVQGVTTTTETVVNVPESVDLEKGNVFDIQFQWRGVGSYFFYINLQHVATLELLGTQTELTMFDPSLPVAYEVINQGDAVELHCGCVDVSSEGGKENGRTYGSIGISNDTGSVSVTGLNVPVLVVRNKRLFGSLLNTRDATALLATGYADQRCVFRVWVTRDETAITLNDQSWQDFRDGHIDYIEYDNPNVGNPIDFDTSKATLVFTARVNQDQSYSTSALFEGRTDIQQTPGDIFVFTIHRETGGSTNVGVTYEFAEAI